VRLVEVRSADALVAAPPDPVLDEER
jgi:hypothetical protein